MKPRDAALPGLLFALAIGSASSCTCSRKHESSPSDSPSAAIAEPDFNAGDVVVIEEATFFEAVVRRSGKNRLQVDTPDAGAPRDVDTANVYAITPRTIGAALANNAFAICRTAPATWVGCRIEGRAGDRIAVSDENGVKAEVDATSVLKPTAVTELNLRQSFEQAAKRKVFLDGARDAGVPQAAKGWSPRPGDHVLVVVNERYVGGKVQRIKKGLVFVVVDGEGKEARIFSRSDVHPQPPVVFTPSTGTYACARPGPGEPSWPVVRIEAASDGKVTVSDAKGSRRTVEVRDLIPLGM
jgi:hypothetical protein